MRHASRGGRIEAVQHFLCGVEILLCPERMVVAHRLAPVRQRKTRIRLLRFSERLGRLVELKIVERLDANQKRILRGAGGGGRERDRAELLTRWA